MGTDTFVGADGPERLPMTSVSWDVFELLRVAPALGRGFREEEDLPKQNTVIVISHGMWQRRFGGDPGVLGRTIPLSGAPVTVVGVMPAGFYFPNRESEFWRPIAFNPANASRGGHFIGVIARLKPGVGLERADAEMKAISERLAAEYPQNSANEPAEVVALHELIAGPIRPMLLTLLGAVAVVVLIACANVANLLLVRASVREKEIAIRAAFKAVTDGKQVAVLVPTTLLAQQHYATFGERFAPFPVRVAVLSRFVTAKEQKKLADEIAAGLREAAA